MRLNRFENATQLRAAVESRLKRQFSDADWRAIAPDWSPPYDLSDVRDVAARAPDLPALRDERVRNLAADVARLKAQIRDYEPRLLEGSALYTGLVGMGTLYRYVAAEGEGGESADSRTDLSSMYWAIGRLVHEAFAVALLAEKHGVLMGTGLGLLSGSIGTDEVADVMAIPPRHSFTKLIFSKLHNVGPGSLRAYEEGRRKGLAKAMGGLTDTDRLLLVARSTLGADAGWAETWQFYEAVRLDCLAEPDWASSYGLRSFTGWRAFRVAVKRAERRAVTEAA